MRAAVIAMLMLAAGCAPAAGTIGTIDYGGTPTSSDGPGLSDDTSGWVGDTGEDDDGDGYTEEGGDCDDGNPDVSPHSEELCDGLDNNCDGEISMDEADLDGDGYVACDMDVDLEDYGIAGVGYGVDCDPTDGTVYPDADEVLDDGIDQDCTGYDAITCYRDGDGDGWVGDTTTIVNPTVGEGSYMDQDDACEMEGYQHYPGEDCDDGDWDIYPGATEEWDGVDTDCDGAPDHEEVLVEFSSVNADTDIAVDVEVGDPDGHTFYVLLSEGAGYTLELPPGSTMDNPSYVDVGYQELHMEQWDEVGETAALVLVNSTGDCIVWGYAETVDVYLNEVGDSCVEYFPY